MILTIVFDGEALRLGQEVDFKVTVRGAFLVFKGDVDALVKVERLESKAPRIRSSASIMASAVSMGDLELSFAMRRTYGFVLFPSCSDELWRLHAVD